MAQQQKDVIFDYDSEGRIIVDRYAKALDILDGDNQDKWSYELVTDDDVPVHYAKLLGDAQLEVKGAQSVKELTPNATYNVYLDFNLANDSKGFTHPIVMFEFTDQHMKQDLFPYQLQTGDNMVYLGQFEANPGSTRYVTIRMYNNATRTKKGLLVRCMRITTDYLSSINKI